MIDYDDDNLYETYVPQAGGMYAEGTVYRQNEFHGWFNMPPVRVIDPELEKFIYRRPKSDKKEVSVSIPEGWRVLADDEVIQSGDKRQDNDADLGHYLPCICSVSMTVKAAKESYGFIDHIIREIEAPTPVTTTITAPRTERDALKAADESGAIKAWCSGKPVEFRFLDIQQSKWVLHVGPNSPSFCHETIEWRPAPAEPPKAVKLDYRPVSEPPTVGTTVFGFSAKGGGWIWVKWYAGAEISYSYWAPMSPAPEEE